MSNKIASFTITLKDDIDEEQAEMIKTALLLIRGVIAVEPNVSNCELYMAESRAKYKLLDKMLEILK